MLCRRRDDAARHVGRNLLPAKLVMRDVALRHIDGLAKRGL